MGEHNLPWVYRPNEFDDWGWIRDSEGDLAACAKGEKGGKSHDEHRDDGTDPLISVDNSFIDGIGSRNGRETFSAYRIFSTGETFSGDVDFTVTYSESDTTVSAHIMFVEDGGSALPLIMQQM